MERDNGGGEASDREQIVDLMARFAQAGDSGTLAEYAACLTADAAVLWVTGESTRGREAVVARQQRSRESGRFGPGSHTQHFSSTIAVKVAGDSATATSYLITFTDGPGGPAPQGQYIYRDSFRRGGDGWRLAGRSIARP